MTAADDSPTDGAAVARVLARAGAGAQLVRLGPGDAPELLTLQHAAWVREAIANDSLAIPPLHEGLADVAAQLADPDVAVWGVRSGAGRLLGTVRISRRDDRTAFLGRLAVVPDRVGTGLGGALLALAEARRPAGVEAIELVTGIRSAANHAFYAHHGYAVAEWLPGPGIVRMVKRTAPRGANRADLPHADTQHR